MPFARICATVALLSLTALTALPVSAQKKPAPKPTPKPTKAPTKAAPTAKPPAGVVTAVAPLKPESAAQLNRATTLMDQKKYAEAEKVLQALVVKEPKSGIVYANLAVVSMYQERAADALKYMEKAVALEPANPAFRSQLAAFQLENGKAKEAEENARKVILKNPKNQQALAVFAESLIQQKRYAEAIAPLTALRTLQGDKVDDQTEVALILCLNQGGQPKRALEIARKRAVRQPKEIQNLLLWGDMARFSGETTEAEKAYQAALQLDPKSTAAQEGLNLLAGMKGDRDAMISHLEARIQETPNDARLHFQLGILIYEDESKPESERYPGAEKRFARAVGLDPKNPTYLTYHGLSLMFQGEAHYPAAEKLLQAALSIQPTYPLPLFGLAYMYERSNRLSDAEAQYRLLIKNNPNDNGARRGLAGVLWAAGKKTEAYQEMEGLAARLPQDTLILAELASWQVADNQLPAAEKTYQALLKRNPKDAPAWISLARLYQQSKRPAEAKRCYGEALAADPKNPSATLLLGDMLQGEEKLDEAVALYRKTLIADPANIPVRWQLILTLRDQKKYAEALAEADKLQAPANDPNQIEYVLVKPRLMMDQERYEDAIAVLQQIRRENPTADPPLYLLAAAYEKVKRPAQTENLLLEVISRTSGRPGENVLAVLTLGGFYERSERWEESAEQYEKVLRVAPLHAEAMAGLGRVGGKQGKPERAMTFLESLVYADPSRPNPAAIQAIIQMTRQNKAPEKYLAFTERLLAKYPMDPIALTVRARALTDDKPTEAARREAIALYKKILDQNPNEPETLYQSGVQYEALGMKQEALTAYQGVLRAKPQHAEAKAAIKRLGG